MSPTTKYVLRGLVARPLMTGAAFVTMFVVGVTITGVLAMGMGLRSAFTVVGHPNQVIVLPPLGTDESSGEIDPRVVNLVGVDPVVRRTSAEVIAYTYVPLPDRFEVVVLRGIAPENYDLHDMKLIDGRLPEPQKDEVMIGDALRLFLPWLQIGAKVKLITREFTVVGVFHAPGFRSGEAWTTLAKFRTEPKWQRNTVVYAQTNSADDATALVARLNTQRVAKVKARTEPEAFREMMKDFSHIQEGLLVVFVLVVGGAVFTAILLLAILQQRRLGEISLLRALGFRNARIVFLAFCETSLLALLGGGLGLAVGTFTMANRSLNLVSQQLSFMTFRASVTPEEAIIVLAVMLGIGVCGTIAPAWNVATTPITRGLREG
jgi:putative ABC transport system permease protein